MNDANERLEQEWKRWARRPPPTPAAVAARRLVARLEEEDRRKAFPWHRWSALAAAASAAALAVVLTLHDLPEKAAPTDAERLPLKEGVVMIWLDSETPLYLTLSPPLDPPKGTLSP